MKLSLIIRDDISGREYRFCPTMRAVDIVATFAALDAATSNVVRDEVKVSTTPVTGPPEDIAEAIGALFGSPRKPGLQKLGRLIQRMAYHLQREVRGESVSKKAATL